MYFFAVLACIFGYVNFVFADEFTSTNFKSLDPVMWSGSYSSSGGYQLFGSISPFAAGTSTASSFRVNTGFLYYPFVTTPVLSTTAGDSKVTLSWTAASGYLGWNVSAYNIGRSTSSGGPYTYTSLGNVTSSNVTGLTNGTTYYFIVRPEDASGISIATSSQVSSTPSAPSSSGGASGGGGGGGGIVTLASVAFSGRAYPLSRVVVLKDGQVAVKTIAGPDAKFEVSLSNLSTGDYLFGVYGEDSEGRRSLLFTFPVFITQGASTKVSGIFVAPTIAVDKSEVKRGDNVAILGQAAPLADIVISVNSEEEFFIKTKSDKDGAYLYNFDTSPLEVGSHFAKSKAALAVEISSFSKAAGFLVGTKNVAAVSGRVPAKGDLNNDSRVALIDLSIAAYWYKRPSPPASVDFNGDGKVDLVDFSIMAFYWTG